MSRFGIHLALYTRTPGVDWVGLYYPNTYTNAMWSPSMVMHSHVARSDFIYSAYISWGSDLNTYEANIYTYKDLNIQRASISTVLGPRPRQQLAREPNIPKLLGLCKRHKRVWLSSRHRRSGSWIYAATSYDFRDVFVVVVKGVGVIGIVHPIRGGRPIVRSSRERWLRSIREIARQCAGIHARRMTIWSPDEIIQYLKPPWWHCWAKFGLWNLGPKAKICWTVPAKVGHHIFIVWNRPTYTMVQFIRRPKYCNPHI